MSAPIRLIIMPGADPQSVHLSLAFAAPERSQELQPAEAWLEFGDGQVTALGRLCVPTAATWHAAHTFHVGEHTYAGLGPYTARLLWGGSLLLDAGVSPGALPRESEDCSSGPATMKTFTLESQPGRAFERTVRGRLEVGALAGQGYLRLDGGAGQPALVMEADDQPWEQRLVYAKSGTYTLAVDLLDPDGFWLCCPVERAVEVAPKERPAAQTNPGSPASPLYLPAGDQPAALEPASGQQAPWLPGRYVRPLWGWVRTYTSPGGNAVARVLSLGTYLSIHGETVVGNGLWYQTAGQDWISASHVAAVQPCELHGVELGHLGASTHLPPTLGRALVRAERLNVRQSPGVRAGNPPVGQVSSGAIVSIYETVYEGTSTWHRIGPDGWVLSDWLQPLPAEREAPGPQPTGLPVGWVLAPALNVRGRPGVAEDNPPIDQVARHEPLAILASQMLGGTPWHCIGQGRWVEGAWMGVAHAVPRPANLAGEARWISIAQADQTAVAYEGDRPVYAALVATGLPATPTPAGLFEVHRRVPAGRIAGGNPSLGSSYDLEDVPWMLYFHGGYALLGAYWHDGFGRPHSHGCVNLSVYDAWWLYRWAGDDKLAVYIH